MAKLHYWNWSNQEKPGHVIGRSASSAAVFQVSYNSSSHVQSSYLEDVNARMAMESK